MHYYTRHSINSEFMEPSRANITESDVDRKKERAEEQEHSDRKVLANRTFVYSSQLTSTTFLA